MARFRPELETCPICGARGRCHIHAYYGRNIVDFQNGTAVCHNLCILRVMCDGCGHSHAILPDFIIPYSSYGLLFILRVLGEFFARLYTVEQLCERFGISSRQLYKWVDLWKTHKQLWLGVLSDAETTDISFLMDLVKEKLFSGFSQEFIRLTGHSFLQRHANPTLLPPSNAHYRQSVFSPDYPIW